MSTIHELLNAQEELLNSLYWLSEDDESVVSIEELLDSISVQGEEKVRYLSSVYVEVKAKGDAIKNTLDGLKKRLETSRNIEDRLKRLMLDTMVLVNKKTIECRYVKITKCTGPEKLYYPENFQPERLPEGLQKITVTHSPIAAEVKKYVQDNPENFLGLKLYRDDYLRIT